MKKILLLTLITALLFLYYLGASKHKPMQFTSKIEINQPLEKTISLWQNPTHFDKWQDGFISKELINGKQDKVGAISIIKLKQGKGIMELKETVQVANLPSEYKILVEHEHLSNTMLTRFSEIDDNTTLMQVEIDYFKAHFWPVKVMMRLFPSMFKKQAEKWWFQFKDFAEKQ